MGFRKSRQASESPLSGFPKGVRGSLSGLKHPADGGPATGGGELEPLEVEPVAGAEVVAELSRDDLLVCVDGGSDLCGCEGVAWPGSQVVDGSSEDAAFFGGGRATALDSNEGEGVVIGGALKIPGDTGLTVAFAKAAEAELIRERPFGCVFPVAEDITAGSGEHSSSEEVVETNGGPTFYGIGFTQVDEDEDDDSELCREGVELIEEECVFGVT